MLEARLRTKIPQSEMDQKVAKILLASDYNLLLTGPAKLMKPDGTLLCVYLPGAVKAQMDEAYEVLTTIRDVTENRGNASGTAERAKRNNQLRGVQVASQIIGAFEASGYHKFCRLTAWTGKQMNTNWPLLLPLFQAVGREFAAGVPDRHQNQMRKVQQTPPEWVVQGTPFTTVTVNNSYPTGVHKDAGDLEEGFSCLAVARRGEFTGGTLTFPEYRVAVDMQDGDLILMDAHAWHGNTDMKCACGQGERFAHSVRGGTGPCECCGAERISVVMYYRTKMSECGTFDEEAQKAVARAERANAGTPVPSEAEDMAAQVTTTEVGPQQALL